MDNIKIQITYNDNVYAFEYGSQAYIFHTGIYNDVDDKYGIDGLLEYTAKVHECYLADSYRTPLGELCDYVAARWKSVKKMSKHKILEKFYTEIGL